MTLLVAAMCAAASFAQTSRRTIEKFADEATRQIALTGRTPTIDLLDSLANNAEVSIDMLSRMGDPDDARQQRACLKLIDCIVDYSEQPSGRRYTDVVRKGLTKALDRSYDTGIQLHMMEQLARCAKPADAAHIAMYLEMPELAPTAYRILVAMPDIDDRIAEAAAAQPGIKARVQNILDVRAGKRRADSETTAQPAKPQKPEAVPMWTESLKRAVADMCRREQRSADSIVIRLSADKALPQLMQLARRCSGDERDAVIARCVMLAERVAGRGDITPEERYLVLRSADELATDPILRQKIIVDLGMTHTIQALVYLRRYTGKPDYADALAIAATEIIGAHPEANGGRAVSAMMYSAKQSFIRHYDEQGIDAYIDQVLAAIDNWREAAGFDMAHTDNTRMEKRGFWILHDELQDFDIVFDWQASGTLTLSLHSSPVLTVCNATGARIGGDSSTHPFRSMGDWSTATIHVSGNRLTLSINGHIVADNAALRSLNAGEDVQKEGTTKFLADDNGAVIRQFCFCRK